MLFNSIEFLIFFPIVIIIYFSLNFKFRWMFLLAASYYFYMCWKIEYVVLILISTFIAYITAFLIEKRKNKKLYLIISIFANLGILFCFKYFNFVNESLRSVFDSVNIVYDVPSLKLLLPVGISFYTFQTLSYSIDVYRGVKKPEKHFGIFALYVSFFPQLVAGPIERSTHLLPQFKKHYKFDYNRAVDGLKLMLWGFFKKIVIADRAALIVTHVYSNPHDFTGVPLIIASYLFAFQIYCDFSAYSDIAIGSAQIMGYNLMDNFNRPYFSKSISEFWKRWHISLSSWLRDYLFLPVSYTSIKKLKKYKYFQKKIDVWGYSIGISITMLLGGLWHGANWTFVVWGMLHGFYQAFSVVTRRIRKKILKKLKIRKHSLLIKVISIVFTFHLVVFSWIFFRANSISDAIYIISNLFNINKFKITDLGVSAIGFNITLISIIFMEIIHLMQGHIKMRSFLSEKPIIIRWGLYYLMIITILIFGAINQEISFIYFQF